MKRECGGKHFLFSTEAFFSLLSVHLRLHSFLDPPTCLPHPHPQHFPQSALLRLSFATVDGGCPGLKETPISHVPTLLHTSDLQSTAQIVTHLLPNFFHLLPRTLPTSLPHHDVFGLLLSPTCYSPAYSIGDFRQSVGWILGFVLIYLKIL